MFKIFHLKNSHVIFFDKLHSLIKKNFVGSDNFKACPFFTLPKQVCILCSSDKDVQLDLVIVFVRLLQTEKVI